MLILITYDVNTETEGGKKRLRKVAKQCMNYGQRVQNSVFECELDATQYKIVKGILEEIIDEKKDSLRFYKLGKNGERNVEKVGVDYSYSFKESLIM